jgi:tetratricopeptide (TPR) repeat protein
MIKLSVALLVFLGTSSAFSLPASAFPTDEQIIKLNNSVVKVHVSDKNGNHGIGTGVVVSENHVATSCHVIANARSARVAKEGRRYEPIALKADWRHDLCILKFDDLPLKPLPLGDSADLKYEQEVFSLGFPQNSPRPQPSFGYIKALYPLDDSVVIRTSAGFRLGASGGPLLDKEGMVIGITTFKSPGRFDSFYYSLPVKWVQQLLTQPDILISAQKESPFWDVPEEQRPFFMQVVPPLKEGMWGDLERMAKTWCEKENVNAEAWYYLGLAEYHQKNTKDATEHLQKAIALNKQHSAAYFQLGLIAAEQGNKEEKRRIGLILSALDTEAAEALDKVVGP